MKSFHFITFLLLIIGGINWLLVGVSGWDIGELFGGQTAIVSRVIYILVGFSAIVEVATHKKCCTTCASKTPSAPSQPATPQV